MARPLLLTVATDVFDELQVTCVVISWLCSIRIAYRWLQTACYSPQVCSDWLALQIWKIRVAEPTVRVVLPEILPEVAVMVAVRLPLMWPGRYC